MQAQNTPARRAGRTEAQLVIRPKLAPAALRLLDRERCEGAPEYAETIQRLIDAVNEGRPIDLSAYLDPSEAIKGILLTAAGTPLDDRFTMSLSEWLKCTETVERYMLSTISYVVHTDTSEDGTRSDDWRYLSDLAALAADIEAALAPV